MTNEREKQLFDELLSIDIIQDCSNKLKVEIIKKQRWPISIEICGLQTQQGQLMRQIEDYSDTFDGRFRVLELNSTIGSFFLDKKNNPIIKSKQLLLIHGTIEDGRLNISQK